MEEEEEATKDTSFVLRRAAFNPHFGLAIVGRRRSYLNPPSIDLLWHEIQMLSNRSLLPVHGITYKILLTLGRLLTDEPMFDRMTLYKPSIQVE